MEEQLRQIAQYILLGVGINSTALLGIMGGIIYLVIHFTRFARGMDANQREMATMVREVAFMIRRQYGDIDRDLQEIKELLGGQ
jgi:hypothetical protein